MVSKVALRSNILPQVNGALSLPLSPFTQNRYFLPLQEYSSPYPPRHLIFFLPPFVYSISPLVSRLSVSLLVLIYMCTFWDISPVCLEDFYEIITLVRCTSVE